MTGIFDNYRDSVFATYAGTIEFRDRLAGGTPSDPKLIEGWLKSRMPGMTNELERRHMLIKTLTEMGADLESLTAEGAEDIANVPMEMLEKAAEKVAATRGANGFKRPDRLVTADGDVIREGHLAIETRHLKAHLFIGALAA